MSINLSVHTGLETCHCKFLEIEVQSDSSVGTNDVIICSGGCCEIFHFLPLTHLKTLVKKYLISSLVFGLGNGLKYAQVLF